MLFQGWSFSALWKCIICSTNMQLLYVILVCLLGDKQEDLFPTPKLPGISIRCLSWRVAIISLQWTFGSASAQSNQTWRPLEVLPGLALTLSSLNSLSPSYLLHTQEKMVWILGLVDPDHLVKNSRKCHRELVSRPWPSRAEGRSSRSLTRALSPLTFISPTCHRGFLRRLIS